PHLRLRTGGWPVPGGWWEGVQVLFDAGRFRLEKRDAVCTCPHVFVPLYILTKNLSVPLTRAERWASAAPDSRNEARAEAGRRRLQALVQVSRSRGNSDLSPFHHPSMMSSFATALLVLRREISHEP